VRLARSAVYCLNPETAFGLVVRSEHDLIAFAHRVEKVLAAVQTCRCSRRTLKTKSLAATLAREFSVKCGICPMLTRRKLE